MKKICLTISMVAMTIMGCQKENKEDKQDLKNDEIVGTYEGNIRLFGVGGHYQDSIGTWVQREWDDTLGSSFSVTYQGNAKDIYMISYEDENDSMIMYRDNIKLSSSKSYKDTIGGGSSFNYIHVLFRNDSLITESVNTSGLGGGVSQTKIRAKKLN